MTTNHDTQPRIDELMSAFLARRATAVAAGQEAVEYGEVEAFEAVPTQSVDPRQAWDGALEVIGYFLPKQKTPSRLPAGWSSLVNALPSAIGLPMAIGNFPQSVRDLPALLQAVEVATESAATTIDDMVLASYIEQCTGSKDASDWLLAIGLLRLTGRYEAAVRVVAAKSERIPAELSNAWTNERAALAWQMGDHRQATKLWNSLPASAPVLFNRGIAELFAGSAAAAIFHFKSAVAQLPDSSSWHHLGRLYLALAESR